MPAPSPAPIPEPEPAPEPDPGHCLAMGEQNSDDLLDTLLAGDHDPSSVDAVMQNGIWLA
jgi:hypothetical protein